MVMVLWLFISYSCVGLIKVAIGYLTQTWVRDCFRPYIHTPSLARAKEKALARPLSNPDPCRFVPPFLPYRTPRRMGFVFALAFNFLRAGPGTLPPLTDYPR